MDVSFSIPATRFSGLAPVTPMFAPAPTTTITPALVAPAFDAGSSIVELSATGVALAATFGFEGDLQTLQAETSGTAPNRALRQAEGLVGAFNALQENIAPLQSGLAATGEASSPANLAQTLNTLVTTTVSDALAAIGISVRPIPADGTAGIALAIDRQALANAIATDAPGTSALLDRTIQSLIDRTAAFESQAATALAAEVGTPTASAPETTAVAANNGNAPGNPDLALARNVTDRLRDAALTTATTAASRPAQGVPASTNGAAATAATTAINGNPGIQPIPTLVIAPTGATGNPAIPTAGANAADREAFAARLALQTALDNPTRRSLDIIFDPAYSALMAATHPSDFVLQTPAFAPPGLPDTVQPIVPVRALDRIAGDAYAGGEPRRRIDITA